MSRLPTGTGFDRSDGEMIARRVRGHALPTGIATGLLLFYGFAVSPEGVSGNQLYDGSVAVFTWVLKTGGIVLAVATLACFVGVLWAMLLDGVVSLIIGALFVGTSVVWITFGDIQGFLTGLFALMFLYAGRGAVAEFASMRKAAGAGSIPGGGQEDISSPPPVASGENTAISALLKVKGKTAEKTAHPTESTDQPVQPLQVETISEPLPASEPSVLETQKTQKAYTSQANDALPPEGFLAALAKEDKKNKPSATPSDQPRTPLNP